MLILGQLLILFVMSNHHNHQNFHLLTPQLNEYADLLVAHSWSTAGAPHNPPQSINQFFSEFGCLNFFRRRY